MGYNEYSKSKQDGLTKRRGARQMVNTGRRPITAEQATSFNRYSAANASQVQARLTCGCEPYQDVLTYNRWRALGYQVMRGQKAIKLPIIIEIEDEEDGEVKKRFWTAAVFCRHQVKTIGAPESPTPESPSPVKMTQPAPEQTDVMKGWRRIQ